MLSAAQNQKFLERTYQLKSYLKNFSFSRDLVKQQKVLEKRSAENLALLILNSIAILRQNRSNAIKLKVRNSLQLETTKDHKFSSEIDFRDLNAQNLFESGRLVTQIVKFACRCNYCRIRDAIINQQLVN